MGGSQDRKLRNGGLINSAVPNAPPLAPVNPAQSGDACRILGPRSRAFPVNSSLPRWRRYAAPGLLILVATVQLTLVQTHHLTPWKGGGFGMFSTFDSPSARTLRLTLETTEGAAVVAIPKLHVPQKRLRNMPDTRLLEDLAERTAALPWRVYAPEQIAAARRSLPGEIRRQVTRHPPDEPLAFPTDRPLRGVTGQSPEVLGVRAEVWRWRYDAATHQLQAEVLNTAVIP